MFGPKRTKIFYNRKIKIISKKKIIAEIGRVTIPLRKKNHKEDKTKEMRLSFIKCLFSGLTEQYEMEAEYENVRQIPPTPRPILDPNAWREEAIRQK